MCILLDRESNYYYTNILNNLTSLIETLIFFIFKKNNDLYLYINYYKLNKIIIKNRYFLSLINKILDYLNKAKYSIKLDLKNIYYYI